jgi:hypothetical protein
MSEIIPDPKLYTSDNYKVVNFYPSYWQGINGEVIYSESRFIPYSSKYKEFPFNPDCLNNTNLPTGTLEKVISDIDGNIWNCYKNGNYKNLWLQKINSTSLSSVSGNFEGEFYISSGKHICFINNYSVSALTYKRNSLFLNKTLEISAFQYSNDVLTCLDKNNEIITI